MVTSPVCKWDADLKSRFGCRLQDVTGGNEARLAFLANLQTVKLVGRSSLQDEQLETLQALLEHRKAKSSENLLANVVVASPTSPPSQPPPPRSQDQPKLNGSVGPARYKPMNNTFQRYAPFPNRFAQSSSTLPKEY